MLKKILFIITLLCIGLSNLSAAEDKPLYICPMHPHIHSDKPGTCPICGMDLVPYSEFQEQSEPVNSNLPESTVTIPSAIIQATGVKTEKVEEKEFGKTIKAYGIIKENQRMEAAITSHVSGWIDELFVSAEGDEVKKGDKLFTIYSHQLIEPQKNYLNARLGRIKSDIKLAEDELRRLGMTNDQITELKKLNDYVGLRPFFKFSDDNSAVKPIYQFLEKIDIFSHSDGVVKKLDIRKGSFVEMGVELLRIQDYSKLWVEANIPEKDFALIFPKSKTRIIIGGEDRETAVDYIYPTIDEKNRTGKIRLVIDNKDGKLKADGFADVIFETERKKRISVPSEAILSSSKEDKVIISLGKGRFAPRTIKTGITSDSRTEILEGLAVNEEVVVSGQFMIDSESSLHEAMRKISTDGGTHVHH